MSIPPVQSNSTSAINQEIRRLSLIEGIPCTQRTASVDTIAMHSETSETPPAATGGCGLAACFKSLCSWIIYVCTFGCLDCFPKEPSPEVVIPPPPPPPIPQEDSPESAVFVPPPPAFPILEQPLPVLAPPPPLPKSPLASVLPKSSSASSQPTTTTISLPAPVIPLPPPAAPVIPLPPSTRALSVPPLPVVEELVKQPTVPLIVGPSSASPSTVIPELAELANFTVTGFVLESWTEED